MIPLEAKERRKESALSYVQRVLFRELIFLWIGKSDLQPSSTSPFCTYVIILTHTEQVALCGVPWN